MKRTGLIVAVLAVVATACGAEPAQNSNQIFLDPDVATSTTAAATTTEPPATTTTDASAITTAEAPATTSTTTDTTIVASDELVTLYGALEKSATVTSGRMEGSMEISGLDPSQGFTEMVIPFGGAFDNANGNYAFYMDMSGLAAAAGDEIPPEFADLFGEMEVRQIGDTAYMKFGFFTMLLGAETEWISMPADEGTAAADGFVSTSPTNPAEVLNMWKDVGAAVEVIGTETINGVKTTHYRAVFDTEALLATATPEERAEFEAMGPIPADFMPMDVWISDDGLVIRFVMEIDGTGLATTPEESFERMVMQYDLFDLGGEVVIEPPPADQVTDIEDLEGGFGF